MKDLPPAPSKRLLSMKSQKLLDEVDYIVFLFIYENSGKPFALIECFTVPAGISW